MIRIEQLRQENERLQEKIAEYQRKELEDIRSYAQLSAENISLRQQQQRSGGGSSSKDHDNQDDDDESGDGEDKEDTAAVSKESWETARLKQELDRKEHEKQALNQKIRRLKREVNVEREKRLRLERIMVSAGIDLDQLISDEDDDEEDNRKAGASSSSPTRRPKTYKAKNRIDISSDARLRYPCPAEGCTYVMAVSAAHDAPTDEHGNLSDKRGWPLSMRNNALRMRKHMEEFHPDFPAEDYPPGFVKKFSYSQPQNKRPRHSHPPTTTTATTTTATTTAATNATTAEAGQGGGDHGGDYAFGNHV